MRFSCSILTIYSLIIILNTINTFNHNNENRKELTSNLENIYYNKSDSLSHGVQSKTRHTKTNIRNLSQQDNKRKLAKELPIIKCDTLRTKDMFPDEEKETDPDKKRWWDEGCSAEYPARCQNLKAQINKLICKKTYSDCQPSTGCADPSRLFRCKSGECVHHIGECPSYKTDTANDVDLETNELCDVIYFEIIVRNTICLSVVTMVFADLKEFAKRKPHQKVKIHRIRKINILWTITV